jgi:hypothetical protein
MTLGEIISALLGSRTDFEGALSSVHEHAGIGLLLAVIQGLDSVELDNAERERRLGAIYKRSSIGSADMHRLGQAGASISNSVLRNALAQLLPAEFKGLVFRQPSIVGSGNDHGPVEVVPESAVHGDSAIPGLLGELEQEGGCSDVVILSIADLPATKKLLGGAGFVPLRCGTTDELDKMLAANTDVCAFLLESSFVSSLSKEAQRALIEKLAEFSTFTWLRFQEDGLKYTYEEVAQVISHVRCRMGHPEVTELSFQDRADLRERELSFLSSARGRLRAGRRGALFMPGEINAAELSMLCSAMNEYSKRRRFNPGAELTSVVTKFLHGGQSGAKVALIRLNNFQVPLIVKLAQKEMIIEEAKRFLTYIQRDNRELNPEVHLHASSALILFDVITTAESEANEPAPTLRSELMNYWYAEMNDPASCCDGSVLFSAVTNAASKLCTLNKQTCADHSFKSFANPYVSGVKRMEEKGFQWGFAPAAIGMRSHAETIALPASKLGVCHGDAHCGNFLIRRDQAYLIDYAYSGPGHPCVDLVKLELSLYFTHFHPFCAEAELVALQNDISIGRLSIEAICEKYPEAVSSKSNLLILRMCIVARSKIEEVLASHGLNWEHYLSIKLLTAWSSLQIPSLQQSLVRSVVSAISL